MKVGISNEIKKGKLLPAEKIVDLELQNDGQVSKRQLLLPSLVPARQRRRMVSQTWNERNIKLG